MNSYLKLVQAQAKLLLREPLSLFFTIVLPTLMLVLFGAVFGNTGAEFAGSAGADAASQNIYSVNQYVPALMALVIGTVALNTIPVSTANDREQGILRRFKATPMPSWQWMASEISAYFVVALLGVGVLVVTGRVVFGMQFFGNWGFVFLGFTLSALSFMAFGYLVASLSATPRIASVLGQLLYTPMIFLSGAVFPLSLLPDSIEAVAQWLPMTHVVIVMQSLWLGEAVPMLSIWILLGILVMGGALSARLFRWE